MDSCSRSLNLSNISPALWPYAGLTLEGQPSQGGHLCLSLYLVGSSGTLPSAL